jgi:Mor family transcriptional regulator
MVTQQVAQKDIIRDIRSGMDEAAIRKKYNLSLKGLQTLYDRLIEASLLGKEIKTRSRKLNLLAVLADIRAGVNRSDLRKKYGLTDETLREVIKKLLAAEGKRSADDDGPETLIEEPDEFLTTHEFVRHEVDFDLPVYEADRPETLGMVRDVSEAGMSVTGIEASEGDIKTLVVLGDELGQFSSFEFEGYCRWCFTDSVDRTCFAGFAIQKISKTDARELKRLVHTITTGG